ncbi:MAG: endonuclease/exonuclease/phosphatase family protein [Acidimicrobiia bacterium]
MLLVQIDGLSRRRLEAAIAAGRMPFLARLIAAGELREVPVYSGMPSTTPAAQAELFYGVDTAVPAFTFVDHETGRLMRMYEHAAATAVEQRIAARSSASLLAGGASYANVYTGGASDARFCMASLGVGDLVPHHLRRLTPVVVLAYAPALLRIAAVSAIEMLGVPGDLWSAVHGGEDRGTELKFSVSRILVGVVLRELAVLGMSVDLARGLRVIHGNFLGYDETAHRRGPDSTTAFGALRPIDAAIERLWKAAHRSHGRAYDVWIMSDHGQEATESYAARHGETVAAAIGRIAVARGLVDDAAAAFSAVPATGVQHQRSRQLGERAIGRIVPGLDLSDVRHEPGSLAVAAQGPLGLVYLPGPLPADELADFARAIVTDADVPMVLQPGINRDEVVVHTSAGTSVLPRDAAVVLGADHPYREEVAHDLVTLVHHPDAGDLVFAGWRRGGRSVSFPFENGAHAGPGSDETDAFALVPPDTPMPSGAGVVRHRDLRRAAFTRLDGGRATGAAARRRGIRVLTYNVHSCVGIDGRISPERIARVIARQDPDIVALQEVDVGRTRTGGIDQAREIAAALEMELEFHPTISVAEERFGDAVLSRHPLRPVRAGMLPGIGLEPRGAMWVDVDVPDGAGVRTVPVLNTHLSLHPVERLLAARALLGGDWLGAVPGDAVLCGDFNALSWFPSMALLRRHLRDAQTGLDGHRPRSTWFGRYPIGRIDHVLVDPSWTVVHADVPDDTLARVASDHRPLVVDLVRR